MNVAPRSTSTERYPIKHAGILAGLRFGDAIESNELLKTRLRLQLRVVSADGSARDVFLEPMSLMTVRELTLSASVDPLLGIDALHDGEALEVVIINNASQHVELRPFATYCVRGEPRLCIETAP